MALWGNNDGVYSDGTISIDLGELKITGAGTTFTTAHAAEGNIITVGVGATYGEAIITSVASNTSCAVASTEFLIYDPTTGLIPAGTSYFISQKPVSTVGNSQYEATEIFGVDTVEQGVANAASGAARKFAPAHSGWVGITSYIDGHGTLRVKTEVLVANSTIDSDAADDDKYADS